MQYPNVYGLWLHHSFVSHLKTMWGVYTASDCHGDSQNQHGEEHRGSEINTLGVKDYKKNGL